MVTNTIESNNDRSYNSIAGWLLLFGIIFTISVFFNLLSLIIYFRNWYDPEFWNMLSEMSLNNSSYFQNTFFITFSVRCLIIVFQVCSLIAFFIKSKKAPLLIISLQIVSITALSIIYFYKLLSDADLPYHGTILVWLQIIVSCSVIAYFSISRRVRGTFVR